MNDRIGAINNPTRNQRRLYRPFTRTLEGLDGARELLSNLTASAEITHATGKGRFVRATRDIDACIKIGEGKAFVTTADLSDETYCITCHSTQSNFIGCQNCQIVVFCNNISCEVDNETHEYECGTIFEMIKFENEIEVKITEAL